MTKEGTAMLKVWGKIWVRGRIRENLTVTDDHVDWPLEERLSACEEEIVSTLDLARPIWLEKNRKELANFGATKFEQDNFIESIPFQSLELEIIGTDDDDEENV